MFDRRRPDPQLGIFETLLVLDGRPVELDAHLARLMRSLDRLFPDHAPPDLDRMEVQVENGVMRLHVMPSADRLGARISFREPGERFGSVALHSLPIAGGLGLHKWADRSLLDEAQAGLPEDALPLIVDEDGAVLEASRANVFAVREGVLLTPPLDGRILPGVTRMRVLELAGGIDVDAHEAELSRADLLAADEVFLTGSVRGVERVRAVDGEVCSHDGDLADRIATELRLTWAGAKFG